MHKSVPSTKRRSDGLAVAFALGFPTLVTWVYFVALADAAPALQQTAYSVGKVLQFAFPIAWVLLAQRVEIRGLSRFSKGEDGKVPIGTLRGLAIGAGFGAIVFLITVLGYHFWLKPAGFFAAVGDTIHHKVTGFGVDSFWPYVALGTFYSVCHSFLEEYYWRWFVFGQLRRLVSSPVAIAVSSVGFMAHHVLVLGFYFGWLSPATLVFSAAVGVGGAVWAWLYNRSGSLYTVWVSHFLIDAAIFTVGYDLVRPYFLGG